MVSYAENKTEHRNSKQLDRVECWIILRGGITSGRQVFLICLHFKAGVVISCTRGHHGRQMASDSFDTDDPSCG